MSIEKFRRYDLNLLLWLHVLIEEQSVSAAARRLGLTQGAMSRALARMRDQLGDDLLMRVGASMVLTPRAVEMKEPLERFLYELGALLEPDETLEPAVLDAEFSLATADYPGASLVTSLVSRLRELAPKVRLRVEALDGESPRRLSLGELDLIVAPRMEAPLGIVWSPVRQERFVVVARAGHPRVHGEIDLEGYLREDHVLVSPDRRVPDGIVDRALGALDRRRRVAVRVPSFSAAPLIVMTSDLIATLPWGATRPPIAAAGLSHCEPPLELPTVQIDMGWHERVRRDEGHAWFRDLVRETAAALG